MKLKTNLIKTIGITNQLVKNGSEYEHKEGLKLTDMLNDIKQQVVHQNQSMTVANGNLYQTQPIPQIGLNQIQQPIGNIQPVNQIQQQPIVNVAPQVQVQAQPQVQVNPYQMQQPVVQNIVQPQTLNQPIMTQPNQMNIQQQTMPPQIQTQTPMTVQTVLTQQIPPRFQNQVQNDSNQNQNDKSSKNNDVQNQMQFQSMNMNNAGPQNINQVPFLTPQMQLNNGQFQGNLNSN